MLLITSRSVNKSMARQSNGLADAVGNFQAAVQVGQAMFRKLH